MASLHVWFAAIPADLLPVAAPRQSRTRTAVQPSSAMTLAKRR